MLLNAIKYHKLHCIAIHRGKRRCPEHGRTWRRKHSEECVCCAMNRERKLRQESEADGKRFHTDVVRYRALIKRRREAFAAAKRQKQQSVDPLLLWALI